MPELLGRLPIRVELRPLKKSVNKFSANILLNNILLKSQDFKRILVEPKYNLIKQQKELLKTEDIQLEFTEESLEALAARNRFRFEAVFQ